MQTNIVRHLLFTRLNPRIPKSVNYFATTQNRNQQDGLPNSIVFSKRTLDVFKFDIDYKAHRVFFDQLAKQFKIEKPTEWYNVKVSDVEENGGSYILKTY